MGDDEIYGKPRLVYAALIAKIHTVGWTPTIIAHPTTVFALLRDVDNPFAPWNPVRGNGNVKPQSAHCEATERIFE